MRSVVNEVNDESSSWLKNEEDLSKNGLKTNQETGSSSTLQKPQRHASHVPDDWIPSFCVPDFQDHSGTRFYMLSKIGLKERFGTRSRFLFCVPKYSSHHETKTTCHPCSASTIAGRSSGFRHLRSPNALPLRLHPPLSRTCPGVLRSSRSAPARRPRVAAGAGEITGRSGRYGFGKWSRSHLPQRR